MPQLGRIGGATPKNLTSDWLMVTALSSVIGPHLMVREVARRRATSRDVNLLELHLSFA